MEENGHAWRLAGLPAQATCAGERLEEKGDLYAASANGLVPLGYRDGLSRAQLVPCSEHHRWLVRFRGGPGRKHFELGASAAQDGFRPIAESRIRGRETTACAVTEVPTVAPGAPERRRGWGPWIASGLLSLTTAVFFGSAGIVAPICYGYVRAMHIDLNLAAFRPELAWEHTVLFLVGLSWTSLWLAHVVRVRRRKFSAVHVVLPMLVFAVFAWNASRGAYSCNPM